jgi:hypothetical protein
VPVFITEKHLVGSDERMTCSDTKQKCFALRTTPNSVFTFYYQHLCERPASASRGHLLPAAPRQCLVPAVFALPAVWWSAVAGHVKWTEIEADLFESNTTRQARLSIILWKQMA